MHAAAEEIGQVLATARAKPAFAGRMNERFVYLVPTRSLPGCLLAAETQDTNSVDGFRRQDALKATLSPGAVGLCSPLMLR
jgi:hypothetical protein